MERKFTRSQLRRVLAKYDTVETLYNVSGTTNLKLTEVKDTYVLLDKMIQQEKYRIQIDRFPYWAEIWASSLALAFWLYNNRKNTPSLREPVLELGCGVGLVGLALADMGWRVNATDYVDDALAFASFNAFENNLNDRHKVSYLDWRKPFMKQYSFVVASDIIYEKSNHRHLFKLLSYILKPGGIFFVSDPKRRSAKTFVKLLCQNEYSYSMDSTQQKLGSLTHQIDIHCFKRSLKRV